MTPREYTAVLTPLFERHRVPRGLWADVVKAFTTVGHELKDETRLYLFFQEAMPAVNSYWLQTLFPKSRPTTRKDAKPLNYRRILESVFDRFSIPERQRSKVIAYLTEFGHPRPRVSGLEECRKVLGYEMLRANIFPTVRRKLEAA